VSDSHSRIDAAIKAFANGEIVVVTDDDDRENEGDLFVGASLCTSEKMAFIIRNTSGIVCAPLGAEHARRLHLDPMVAENDAPLGTAFTVTVDVRHGLTTGIKLVERVAEFQVASEIGALQGYAYVTPFDRVHHMAFVYGDIGDGRNVPARLHRADVIGDVFGGAKTIHAALARFKTAGCGVIVYLRDGTAGVPVAEIPHDGGTDAARSRQWREIGLGAQILKDIGISSIRLLSSSKRTYVGLGGFGIEIVETEGLEG